MQTPKNHFLVPVDFSEQSLIALEQSYNLAKLYDADLTLLFVKEIQSSLSKLFSRSDNAYEDNLIMEKLNELAAEVSAKVGVPVYPVIESGKVHEQILEVSNRIQADLIIMGTNGVDDITKKLVGTNALKVVKESSCPVITIKGKSHHSGCRNILLPLDLTKTTTQKIEQAVSLAKKFNGATIRLVSVLLTNDESIVDRLTSQMEENQNSIIARGVNCVGEIVRIIKEEDTFSNAIIAYANKVEADLIVIMTQQEDQPARLFIGSSAQAIINESEIPVLSMIPEEEANK